MSPSLELPLDCFIQENQFQNLKIDRKELIQAIKLSSGCEYLEERDLVRFNLQPVSN
jgi:hypothetical protein